MARKRSPTKPETIRGRPTLDHKYRDHIKSNETISSDLTTLGRYLVIVVLIMGITAFLFYPDIKRVAKSVKDRGFSDVFGFSEDQGSPTELGEDLSKRQERNSQPSVDDHTSTSDVDSDGEKKDEQVVIEEVEEDLMEGEEEIKQENIKPHKSIQPETVNEKKNNKPGKVETTETRGKQTRKAKDSGKDKPDNIPKKEHGSPTDESPRKSHNREVHEPVNPIILNAENSEIVIDPAKINTGSQASKQNQQKPAHQQKEKVKSTEKPMKKKAKKASTPKATATKTKEASDVKSDVKNQKEQENLPDDVKNFKPSLHKTFTPKKIFADGRRIPPVELLHQKTVNSSVKVFLFDEFLSKQECDGLMKAHDAHVKALNKPPILCFDSIGTLKKHIKDAKKKIKVTPNDFTSGTKCVNNSFSLQLQSWLKSNWSYSTAFYPGESKFSKIAAARIQQAMGLDPVSGGKFQITSYPVGKAYKDHTDCIVGGEDKRDRVVSVLMYLNDVEDGGETTFPELGIWVKPRKGRAIVWNNMTPKGECDPTSIHAASVVKKGSKYILIRWYYYKTFYSLGKRPPIPQLPAREAEQAMVMCDEYENGSCRWYDEWNYSHLLDYVKKQYTLI